IDFRLGLSRFWYSKIPYFPSSTPGHSIEGHAEKFIFSKIENISVYLLQGRAHYYEGKTMQEVTFPIRVLKKLGVTTLILTNAAGALNESYRAGEFMLIKDHINLMPDHPLRGKNWDKWGPRFPDLSDAYDEKYRLLAKKIAKEMAFTLQEGIYAAISGPSYETPAEVKMLKLLGADASGMSTVPETIVARHQGMKVLAISCLTNMAAGIDHGKPTHEEVLEVAKKVSEKFHRFLKKLIIEIGTA
ncbi:MAG: purine-nucleoside phosphorylase, partial [Deltaproteobacteria bacterium]